MQPNWRCARNPNPHISWVWCPFWIDLPAECLQNFANGTPSQGRLDLFTYIVQPTCWVRGCGTLWQGPLGGPSLLHPKKTKEGEEEQERDHIRPWGMLLRRLPYRLRCFLSLLKRLFSFQLLVANCIKRSLGTRRTLTRKKKETTTCLGRFASLCLTSDVACFTQSHLLAILG